MAFRSSRPRHTFGALALVVATTFAMVSAAPASAAPTDYEAENAKISKGKVESNHAGHSGTGFVNYDNVVGGYVEWTVTAAQAGPHKLDLRYANGTADNRAMDISVNGAVAADDLAFPGTGAWTIWKTESVTATLKAGSNKIRATAVTETGGPNADKLTVDTAGPVDTQPPTPPVNLRKGSQEPTPTTVSLAWDAATDNVGVTGYDIYEHGQLRKKVDGTTLATTVDGLTPNTEYDWSVIARDAALNASPVSNSITISTPPTQQDPDPPTAPGNLQKTAVSSNSVSLKWDPSSDNVGVTGYEVFKDGALAATSATTTGRVDGLNPNTEYRFTVKARDEVGNRSQPSNELVVKTSPSSGGGGVEPGKVTKVADGVDVPWGIATLPDGTVLVSDRNSFAVYKLTKSGQKTAAGKVPNVVGTSGEGGLLGLEVSPNFNSDHWVYIYHTASEGNRVVRMKYENNSLVQSSYEVLLKGIGKSKFHNGGRLRFGPDGKLYASTGDAENESLAQKKESLNGKILRINPDGSIPSDNPFGTAVWSYGHRNVQGLAFDSQNRLWASEFGNTKMDEINLIRKGGNYGWDPCEGTTGDCDKPGFIKPVRTFAPTGDHSPSGLMIVNDHIFVAQTKGERVYRMKIEGETTTGLKAYFQGAYNRLRTVEKDPAGGGFWLSTSTDKDKEPNNDQVYYVELTGGSEPEPGDFKLSSSAFADNASIPAKYTCAGDGKAGQDPSPPLAWAAGNAGAKGYAIVFADRANSGNKLHWAIWDIPVSTQALSEGLGSGFDVPNGGGAKQKSMGSGNDTKKYFGPCPGGSTNPYTFTLYALKSATVPGITSSSSMAQIETAIKEASSSNTVLRGKSNAKAG